MSLATDPDNLAPGQWTWTPFEWVKIVDPTPDQYGCITVVPFRMQAYPRRAALRDVRRWVTEMHRRVNTRPAVDVHLPDTKENP